MSLLCTCCHQGLLTPTPLGHGLSGHACGSCGAVALDMAGYLAWRATQPKPTAGPEVPHGPPYRPVREGREAHALHCPACRRIMVKHFAHAGASPEVHTCLRCEVIGLEPGVWPHLAQAGLHTSLTTITTTAWQHRRSHLNVQRLLNEQDRHALGDTVYQQTLQIHAWLKAQPQRKQILKLLQRLTQNPP